MPSFDISAKADIQTIDNIINTVKKEILNRFDFKGTHTEIDFDKKAFSLKVEAENDMQLSQIEDVLITKAMRNGVDGNTFDVSQKEQQSGKYVRKNIPVVNGIDKEDAKKIVKAIKDSGLKVQAAIMDDIIRVTAKKIDDLQSVIQMCRNADFKLPLQFLNMKS
ncbi:MAG: YajQ family cyclic di-GMP-binding protein [Taibaiella sp.]|nr:YajQ family cyclic di-GMP-binding protein [Taibaiella sp.]